MDFNRRLECIGSVTEIPNESRLNSSELKTQIELRSIQFKEQGLKPGDRVLIHYGNSTCFIIDLLALWKIQAGVVPVDKSNPQNLSEHCNARFELNNTNSDLKLLPHKSISNQLNEGHLILYTSGSTGDPKGVVHTLTSLEHRFLALEKHISLEDCYNTLCILPTYFGHGLIGNCLFPLLTGQNLFLAEAFTAINLGPLSDWIDRYQITFFSSVPSLWRLLKNHHAPRKGSLKRIHCASAPFAADLYAQIQSWAPSAQLYNVYGTTELGSWISGYHIQSETDEGLVGQGWEVDFKLTDIDSNGQGRVWIHSAGLMNGYLNLPNETNQKIQNGWIDTCDLGYLDQKKGLRLNGRSDDLINRGGLKVNPDEVEKLLRSHNDIEQVCVFSLPHQISGECIGAAVILKKISSTKSHQLESWCRDKITSYKIPTHWFILEFLPMNSRGKISRSAVRQHCLTQKESV